MAIFEHMREMVRKIFWILLLTGVILSADVKVGQRRLLIIEKSLGELSPEERAQRANDIIRELVVDTDFSPDSIELIREEETFYIRARDKNILAVAPSDTLNTGISQDRLAESWHNDIISGIKQSRQNSLSTENILKFSLMVLYPVFLVVLFIILQKITRAFSRWVMKQEGRLVKGVRFGKLEVLKPPQEIKIILQITIVIKYVIFAIIFYTTLLVFLGQFDQTSPFVLTLGNKTVEYGKLLLNNLKNAFEVVLGAVLLYVAMRLILILLNYFMKHYREVPGAQNNLSESAYSALINVLRRAVMVLFVLSVIYIIPGAQELAFALLLIFILIIGLSLVNLLRDLFAGYVLMARGVYQKGDRLKIDEIDGTVIERNFLFTIVRTQDGAEATLHNSLILSKPIIVFKKSEAKDED